MAEKPSYEELKQRVKALEKAENKLKLMELESEEHHKNLYENALVGMWRSRISDGKLLKSNKIVAKICGFSSSEEAVNSNFKLNSLYPSENRDELIELLKKEGSISDFEIHLTLPDGKEQDVSVSVKIFPDKDYMDGVAINITERKQAEELLKKSEERYRRLTENSKAMIYRQSLPDGRYEYISQASIDITGYTPEEICNKPMRPMNFIHPDWADYFEEQWGKLLKGEIPPFYEFQIIHKSGAIKWIKQQNVLIYDENGSIIATEGIVTDETIYKQTELEKIKAQELVADQKKMASVGQLAGKMAHDFNNILGVIMGNTELSLLDCEDEEIKKTLELILEQTLRGKNLTKNLVAFAKDQEPKQEFFQINEKIDLVVSLLRKDLQGIEIIKEEQSGMPDLLADPGMIEHGLVNLIQNSIHALSLTKDPTIVIRTYRLDDDLYFEIEDNGCGIPKEHLSSIYEPSFTLKGKKDEKGLYERNIRGTGYGMANVKKYIEQHNGNVSVQSKLDSGTKFTIKIPVIKKELTDKEKAEIHADISDSGNYILLVEDEQAILDIQYRMLTQDPFNHKVDTASNGQVAMDLLDRNKYDLISLDYILPGDINGMDIYNHARKKDKTVPILFISGNIEFLESIKELKQQDVKIDHLSKPCQNKKYVDAIDMLLRRTSNILP